MRKYTILICDDDSHCRKNLKSIILQYSFSFNHELEILELDSAEKLLDFQPFYDILFLDIRFGNRNIGIDIGESLRALGNESLIILATHFQSMAADGYRAEPFRFLVKPFTQENIFILLNACFHKLNRTLAYVKVTSGFLSESIRTDRIIYIYSESRKRYVVRLEHETIETWQKLNEFKQNLPEDKFVFSHKSYIINLDTVLSVRGEKIALSGGYTVPLSTYYKDSFMKALQLNTHI